MAPWAPAVYLAPAVLHSRLSGNDKAPFVVLLVLALDAAFVLVRVAQAWGGSGAGAWRGAGVAALPLLYAVVIMLLARQGVLDPAVFLGIR